MCRTQSEFNQFHETRFVEETEIKKVLLSCVFFFAKDNDDKTDKGLYQALSDE